MDCDHTRWKSSKIISQLISLTFLLSADLNITDTPKGTHLNFSPSRSGVCENADFGHLSRFISETDKTVQDTVQVTIDSYHLKADV